MKKHLGQEWNDVILKISRRKGFSLSAGKKNHFLQNWFLKIIKSPPGEFYQDSEYGLEIEIGHQQQQLWCKPTLQSLENPAVWSAWLSARPERYSTRTQVQSRSSRQGLRSRPLRQRSERVIQRLRRAGTSSTGGNVNSTASPPTSHSLWDKFSKILARTSRLWVGIIMPLLCCWGRRAGDLIFKYD